MVPPVNADTFLGTEGGIGLYTGTLHIRVRHKAAIKQASFVVVLGRHEGVALGEQAMQGEMGHIVVSTKASPHALPEPPPPAHPCPTRTYSEAPAKDALWLPAAEDRKGMWLFRQTCRDVLCTPQWSLVSRMFPSNNPGRGLPSFDITLTPSGTRNIPLWLSDLGVPDLCPIPNLPP